MESSPSFSTDYSELIGISNKYSMHRRQPAKARYIVIIDDHMYEEPSERKKVVIGDWR